MTKKALTSRNDIKSFAPRNDSFFAKSWTITNLLLEIKNYFPHTFFMFNILINNKNQKYNNFINMASLAIFLLFLVLLSNFIKITFAKSSVFYTDSQMENISVPKELSINNNKNQIAVLGISTTITTSPAPFAASSPLLSKQSTSPTETQTKPIVTNLLHKSSYSIAIFGDSMIDTMGENLNYLNNALHSLYPQTTFSFYNYGIGAENIEMGINRFNSPFNYKSRTYPPISQLHPDFIILGSFSYNPFSPDDQNKHWQLLTELVKDSLSTRAKVYLLAEIAPRANNFAVGPGGIANWDTSYRLEHANEIVNGLKSTVSLSHDMGIPVIDAFDATRNSNGFGGYYTNNYDGIHPSVAGQIFTANLIARTLSF